MNEEKLRNKDAWYAIGGSIAIAVISLIAFIIGMLFFMDPLAIVPFIASLIALGISIIGLYQNRKPQRDGIFSGVFIAHIITLILVAYFLPLFGFIFAIVTLIVACVFDSIYEGKGNAKDKRGENPFADEEVLNVREEY